MVSVGAIIKPITDQCQATFDSVAIKFRSFTEHYTLSFSTSKFVRTQGGGLERGDVRISWWGIGRSIDTRDDARLPYEYGVLEPRL